MKKLRIPAFVALCIMLLASCGDKALPLTAQELLGKDDAALVDARGEGDVTDYHYNGVRCIMQRKYEETLFGMRGTVEYMFSDEQVINQIVATFPGESSNTLVSRLTASLGEPVTLQEESEDTDFLAIWMTDGTIYIARRVPEGDCYILMEQNKK